MKRFRMLLLAAAVLIAPALRDAHAQVKRKERGPGDVTVITSDRLTFDYKKRYALFEHNVLVTDPEMQLACDQLTVKFDDKGKAQYIKAEGRVTITQEDKTAHAGLATYELETGKIVLTLKPRVMRGMDMLEGEQITFWRDDNRMICQPQARLVIYPEQGGVKDRFLGD